jgi:alpha-N-arabinofuranosidase
MATDIQACSQLKALTRRSFMRRAGQAGLGLAAWHSFPAIVGRALGAQASAEPVTARLKIDPDRRLGTIDPKIYGNFIEHLGRCIYGGIYDEGSPLSDADGIRKDVLEATRRLRVTQLRWPGGNFVSGYHWEDGIGPKEARPARYALAWFERESNRFGTDEFLRYAKKLGTEPYICVNVGTGTLDEAMHWLEYCNHPGNTYYSDLRKKNGHAEPYNVKYWGVGNEIYGNWQIGHKNVEDYAKFGLEVAKVMRWMDPTVKLVACGNGNPAWDRVILKSMVHYVDYISAHHYTVIEELKEDYYEIVGAVADMESVIRNSAATAETVSADAKKKTPVYVAFDEWNILDSWADGQKRDDVNKYEYKYTLRDALWVAGALNALQRNCRMVRMANLAQLVNVIAPMHTSPTGLLLGAIYFPLEIYANRSGPIALDVHNASPKFETKNWGAQPFLEVSSTYDEAKRRVTLAVVNRRREGEVAGTIELEGVKAKPGGKAFVITGPSPDARNTWDNPKVVTTQEAKLAAAGSRWEYRFPKHSLTWLEFDVEA